MSLIVTDPLIPTMTDSEVAAWERLARSGQLHRALDLSPRGWLAFLKTIERMQEARHV